MTTEKSILRVAIVGSGPSSFFCTEYLLRLAAPCTVDLFERWPYPFGLIRDAVAPDKVGIRASMKNFTEVALSPQVTFRGNIVVGKNISVDELYSYYHAIIVATGAQEPRKLGIQGESLDGYCDVLSFAGWYNGQPDCVHVSPPLDQQSVVIIGAGNAALDATRILVSRVESLTTSDISAHAFEALRKSCVTDVHIVARRGPYDVRFTPAELELIADAGPVEVVLHTPDNYKPLEEHNDSVRLRRAYQYVSKFKGTRKRVHLHFYLVPKAIMGNDRVDGVLFESTDGTTVYIPCGLAICSVGQQGTPVCGIPYDIHRGCIPNVKGRVLINETEILQGVYVAGAAKLGFNSLIGKNKPDCLETIRSIEGDRHVLLRRNVESHSTLSEVIQHRGIREVSFDDWLKIDALEQLRGKQLGKIRERISTVDEMLESLKK